MARTQAAKRAVKMERANKNNRTKRARTTRRHWRAALLELKNQTMEGERNGTASA